jgi:hypothetical protein
MLEWFVAGLKIACTLNDESATQGHIGADIGFVRGADYVGKASEIGGQEDSGTDG